MKFKAFTLIELLIVIVIIGILATSLIPRLTGLQDKAKYTKVQKDFETFRTAVYMAQSNTNKILSEITGSGCTHCSCMQSGGYTGFRVYEYPLGHACRTSWISALRKIETAAGLHTGALSSMEIDPWGSPYMFDENENENSNCGNSKDYIGTFGKDGYYGGHNPTVKYDDKSLNLLPYHCPGGY